ncbi:MAG: DNA translocase FtsK [Candidatus Pacebacteria bacterium]|nr:DNA translocase FtsK [Candidatus Paceibacterota bacterium]
MLFIPFVFFSSGLVLLGGDWKLAKPNVLLGILILMSSFLILTRSGEVGQQTFANLARLLGPIGNYIFGLALFVIGWLIALQSSIVELIEATAKFIETRKEKRLNKKVEKLKKLQKAGVDGKDKDKEKGRGFSIPKLNLGKRAKKAFSVNQNDLSEDGIGDDQTGTAVVPEGGAAGPQSGKDQDGDNQTGQGAKDKSDLDEHDTLTPSNMPLVWEYPPLSLLSNEEGGEADRGDVKENADLIENTLESFGIQAGVVEVNYGPSVTQYALEVAAGTKLSKITSLSTDLAMALAAPTGQIRIEAPIAGRSLVGIEVPNKSPHYVTLKTMLGSSKLKNHKSKLAVGLGIDVAGKPVLADIATMPHLLIAGATGSGKSICINSFLSSLLFRASPSELRLILVDPKRVELTGYNGIPHLLTPVIVEPSKVVSALKWAVNLMEKRYKQLSEVGVRDINEYNELAGLAAMPSVVIVVDEMADVMLYAPGEVEETITRIAQMARAVGIHLILATQRPSVDVITGLIKANIPARIAFNVSSMTDSRVILDTQGAEKLLGKGDMLFLPPDKAKPVRVQGTYVSGQETKQLIDYLKTQGQQPDYEEDVVTKYKASEIGPVGPEGEEVDELFDNAAKLFVKRGKASASLIQRRLSVGYARAARILDQLHDAGLVGPPEGSKPRDVNMPELKTYLQKTSGEGEAQG